MTPHFVLLFLVGVVAVFVVTLGAAAVWLRVASHPVPARHIATWLAGIDARADLLFEAASQAQMARHAACESLMPMTALQMTALPYAARRRLRDRASRQDNLAPLPATQVKAALDGVLD